MSESTSERGPCGVAIVFALREELKPFLKECRIESQTIKKPATLTRAHFRGVPLWLCQTGVGMANAHEGVEFLLHHAKPALIVSAGCAGATHPELSPGDLLLASEILSETPTDSFKPDPKSRASLETLIREEQLPHRIGPLLTVWKVAGKAMKEEIGRKGALALDMETAAVAAIAGKSQIPFVSLRAIFDPMDEEIPCSEPFDEEHPVGFLIKNPKMILKIPQYARWNRLCQKRLFQILSRLVDSQTSS